jgi:hypothetical protein
MKTGPTATGAFRLAFLAGHCEKLGDFLFYILAAAVRAANIFLIVFLQGEDSLKRLVAVVADVVVYGHGEHLACGLWENCNAVFGDKYLNSHEQYRHARQSLTCSSIPQ